MTTAMASWNFSRKRTSSMQVSSGRPHMLTSNQRGRGNDPVVVLGRISPAVAVNMECLQGLRDQLADVGQVPAHIRLYGGSLVRVGLEVRGPGEPDIPNGFDHPRERNGSLPQVVRVVLQMELGRSGPCPASGSLSPRRSRPGSNSRHRNTRTRSSTSRGP